MDSKWQSLLLRWFLLSICWSTYILYRSIVVGQIKYDRTGGAMVILPRKILTIRIALFFKVLMFILDNYGIEYITVGAFPFLPSQQKGGLEKRFLKIVLEAVTIYITIWNICRLYTWLRSLSWNRSFVRLVNKVIHLLSSVEGTSGPLRLEGLDLLIIYVLQLELTLLQLINYIHGRLYLFVINGILQEMFYNAYIAYLFLALSWIASFISFLKNCRVMGLPVLQQRRKILQLLHLYSRISNGHQDIIVLWLPVVSVIVSTAATLVGHWAAIFDVVLFNHELDTAGKWNWAVQRHLGGALAPLVRILLIGLCNDRLAQLGRYLSLQLLLIDLRLLGSHSNEGSQCFAKELTNLQTCFDLQLRNQPIRNPIMCKHLICDSSFVLEFIFCIFLNALSYVQYGITNGSSLDFQELLIHTRKNIN